MNHTIADQTTTIAAAGYPAVRGAFNRALNACVRRLSAADFAMAEEILELNEPQSFETEDLGANVQVLLTDTALFSRPGEPLARLGRRRAIDRLAPKVPAKRDPLMAIVAQRLPHAFFSVFEVARLHPEGGVLVKDLLDGGRVLRLMDEAIAASTQPGRLFAARFIDLGPWLAGFGIAFALRRSEAAAILIALSHHGSLAEKRDSLHELVYAARIHHADLVVIALEPIISALALAIDQSDLGIAEIAASFRSATGASR